MKKHTREQIADWIKENQLHTRQKAYEANHPIEIEKRRKYGLKLWNNSYNIQKQK